MKAPAVPQAPSDVAAVPKDAAKTKSGLASKVLEKGDGTVHPKASDAVTVHYSGWTTDGKMFDSSVARGEPATFPLGGVIKGWTEGVQLMVTGESAASGSLLISLTEKIPAEVVPGIAGIRHRADQDRQLELQGSVGAAVQSAAPQPEADKAKSGPKL
ncbi:MAG: FKBP-type peptidyl-prolyl cis-trans isomerase [Verrucomicrobiales bacterium]